MERPRKTKIGTEVAHVTCDSDTTFEVKTSKVKVIRPLWLAVLAGQHGHRVSDRSICVYDVYRVTTCRLGRAYCGGLPPTACFNADACTAMSEVGEQRLQSTVKLHLQFSCIMLPAKNRLRVRSENLRYPVSANNLAATGYPVSLHL